MCIQIWQIFFTIGLIHSLWYAINRINIFEWHADPDQPMIVGNEIKSYEKRKLLDEKRKILKTAPLAWKIDHFLQIFLGIATGWFIFWILLDKRINIFDKQNFNSLNAGDLVLFLLGWIGINGRLPSIAHAIVDFMKSGINIGK